MVILQADRFFQTHLLYDPYSASIPVSHPHEQGKYFTNKPISEIASNELAIDDDAPSFYGIARKAGTIFIYAKPGGYNNNEIISI